MNDRRRDLLLGVVVAGFALAYIAGARAIEDSLLADAVGAGGVPQAAGLVLLLAALALVVKSLLARDPGRATSQEDDEATPWRGPLLGAGLLLALAVHVLLLPVLGYIVSTSLLVGAVALLGGARDRLPLGLCTALSGLALWAMFEWALQIRMPSGSLFA
ncbi:MAG: tripartite tricarboxylate transporter TctB family protein [Burkholderiaceae bacterium]